MRESDTQSLERALTAVAGKLKSYRGRTLGEQNTKASLIEPVLEALGWDTRDPDEVHREFRFNPKDPPVDYALKLGRSPRLFVEAKALGEDLSERARIVQVLSYAVMGGLGWCVLTDGDEYRFYNAVVKEIADEKLFWTIRLSETEPTAAAEVLQLISRENLEGNIIDEVWNAFYIDRQVNSALRALIEEADSGLVKLVRKRARGLAAKPVAASVRRLVVRIESPNPFRLNGKLSEPTRPSKPRPKSRKPATTPNALAALIAAGTLKAPLELVATYKNKPLRATLLEDGALQFAGKKYTSCSRAAEAAIASISGKRQAVNGWAFWTFKQADGQRTLAQARDRAKPPTSR